MNNEIYELIKSKEKEACDRLYIAGVNLGSDDFYTIICKSNWVMLNEILTEAFKILNSDIKNED